MKVVYIHHSSAYGGSSRSLGILLPHLMKLGVEPHIITPEGRSSDYFKKITPNVYTLSHRTFPLLMTVVGMQNNGFHFFRNVAMIRHIGRIKNLVKKINPDLIHCNESGLVPVAKMLKKMNIPVVMHARTMPHKSFPRLNNYWISQVKKYCDHLICISGSVAYAMRDVEKKSIIYNPIEKLPTKIDKKEKEIVSFLSLSAIQKSKGVWNIAEAALILKDDPRIHIKIAGRINRHDPSKMTLKEKIFAKLGIIVDLDFSNNLIEFIEENNLTNLTLLGHVDDVDKVISECDVMLAPMHLNAPPRSVYEAGIHGLPSILALEDKIEDIIEDNVTGLLITEKESKELADAMLKLVDDFSLRKRLGEEANKRFVKNHNPAINAEKVFEIYKGLN